MSGAGLPFSELSRTKIGTHLTPCGHGTTVTESLPNLEELSYFQSYVVDVSKAVGHPVRLVQNSDGFSVWDSDNSQGRSSLFFKFARLPTRMDTMCTFIKVGIQNTTSVSQARYTTYASILWFVSKDGITYKVAELCALKFVAEKARELGMVEGWKDLCGHRANGGPCRCDLLVA
ncbi:hypothetical protein BGW80DRAFT_1248731 [Lactifluus volemus]|nr:hypothetical protein BGW80DRAFT_1248731 [Lactifluus volemus]